MRGLKREQDQTGLISRLPAEPGEYELRCVSNWGAGRQISARRPLTLR